MRILLTHTPAMRRDYYGDVAVEGLRASGEVLLHEGEAPLTDGALIAAAGGCDIIVSDRATPGAADLFDASPALRAFVRCAVDIRTIDVAAASRNGVLVTRASPGFRSAVSELVLAMMIDLARGITRQAEQAHRGEPMSATMGRQLDGATLGLIGYGEIGRRVAHLAAAFGMRVLVTDPHVRVDVPDFAQVDLDTVLRNADFLVPLAPATPETENFLDTHAFARAKRGVFVVNASRGNLIDEQALICALDDGTVAGAALDVGRAPDQMPSPELARRPDVIATAHIGGLTPEAIAHQANETVRQVASISHGAAPDGAVNEPAWTRRPPDSGHP